MTTDNVLLGLVLAIATVGLLAHFSARSGLRQVLLVVGLVAYLLPQTLFPLPFDTRAVGLLTILLLGLVSLSSAEWRLSRPTAFALGFLLLSSVWSAGDTSAILAQVAFLVGLLLLAGCSFDEKGLRQALTLLLALLALVTFLVAATAPGDLWLAGRLRGPMINPNSFALITILLYPLVTRWQLLPRLLGTAVAFGVVWETGSRAAVLALALQFLLSVIGGMRPAARVVGIGALGLLAYYLVPVIVQAAATQGAGSESVLRSNNSREAVWAMSLDKVKESPWYGSGLGSITSDFETGSSVFSVLILMGVIGLVLVSVAAWRSIARRPASWSDWRLVLVSGALVNAMFEGWLVAAGTSYALIFWLVLENRARSVPPETSVDMQQRTPSVPHRARTRSRVRSAQ